MSKRKRTRVTWHETRKYVQDFDVPQEFDTSDSRQLLDLIAQAGSDGTLDEHTDQYDVVVGTADVPIAGVCSNCGATLDDKGTDTAGMSVCSSPDTLLHNLVES